MQIAFADFTELLLEPDNLSEPEFGTSISTLQTKKIALPICININSFAKFLKQSKI